jgi:CDP-glycerol glycerophosphotransferase (TagB/SpsB family)
MLKNIQNDKSPLFHIEVYRIDPFMSKKMLQTDPLLSSRRNPAPAAG